MRQIFAIAMLLATAIVPSTVFAQPTVQQRIDAERAKAERTQAQLHQKRTQLHAATLQYDDLSRQLGETNDAITGVNAHLSDLAVGAASTQRRIDWNTVQLTAAQRSLALHDTMLKRRLVDIYENGDVSYVSVLLAAHSFSDFVERWDDLRLLVAANQRVVRERKIAEAHVETVERDLERTRLELQQEQTAQEQARTQLASLASERENLVAVASQQRHQVAAQVAQMEDLTAAEEAQLESLIQERQRELEEQRRASGIAEGGGTETGGSGSFSSGSRARSVRGTCARASASAAPMGHGRPRSVAVGTWDQLRTLC